MAGESVIRLSVINDASPKLKAVNRDAKKLSETVDKSNGVLNNQSKSLKHAALGWIGIGKGAKAATPGIAGAGVAMQAALAPILPFIAAGAALTKVFQTLVAQDFGEAKFESLGGSSEKLVDRLKLVSSELYGTASVTELTAASYDVASAGFSKAADAANVLKAASLGATGGFADLNTTGNALTSVLNAYKLEAGESQKVMDQFIQTQNDGKIVVAEYAANIGKVASVASMLNIPLSEVNAIIAQATAEGVKSEVAFTGLKTSMLKLVSSEGQKKLEKFGVTINAQTIEAEGLAANLEKLSGLGTQALTDIFGAEAIQVMAPILNDMEKFRELIDKQNNSQGVAAKAAFTAADTLQGQIKRLGVAFTNIFADGSEMGEFLKLTLYGINGTIELLGVAIKTLVFPFRLLIDLAKGFFEGLGIEAGPNGPIQQLTEGWFVFLKAVDVGFEKVRTFTENLGKGIGKIASTMVEPMKEAFNWILEKVDEFWNALPEWMRWGISKVTGFTGGVSKTIIEGIKDFATPESEKVKSSGFDTEKGTYTVNGTTYDSATGLPKKTIEPLENKSLTDKGNPLEQEKEMTKQLQRRIMLKNTENDTDRQLLERRYLFQDQIANIMNNEQIINKEKLIGLATTEFQIDKTKILNGELDKQADIFEQIGNTIATGISDALVGAIEGTKTLGEAARNILSNIANQLLQLGINTFLFSAFGGAGGIFKNLPTFASGGTPPVGKPSIVGEKGPEIFVPSRSGKIIPNDKIGGGGVVNNISVNVDATGSNVEGDETQAAQLGKAISQAIQAELVQQKRQGGLLYS